MRARGIMGWSSPAAAVCDERRCDERRRDERRRDERRRDERRRDERLRSVLVHSSRSILIKMINFD